MNFLINKLKIFIPSSLYGRFFLIIIIPAILIQLFTAYFFYERHWDDLRARMAKSAALDVSVLNSLFKDKKFELANEIASLLNFKISFEKYCDTRNIKIINKDREITELKENFIHYKIPGEISNDVNKKDVFVTIKNDDDVMCIIIPSKRLYTPTTRIFLLWVAIASIVIVIVTLLFSRNQLRSITRLAKAADDLGKGIDTESFRPEGAIEIRKAGYAFLKMKDRIERQITQRTEMLAGISHDLRTPLTRLKLELEMFPQNEETENMKQDLIEMEYMIEEYLAFAKDDEWEEKNIYSDIISHISDIIKKIDKLGENVKFISPNRKISINFRPTAFSRALINIIQNGIKYGQKVEVNINITENFLHINIEDMGKGISEKDKENIFKPFFRANYIDITEIKGAGLGLAIASDVIHNHGGRIKVAKGKFGGACFTIILPL